jgi:hypothetical protein
MLHFLFSFDLSYLEDSTTAMLVKTLDVSGEYGQKSLEVRSPLVQNGPDEHP